MLYLQYQVIFKSGYEMDPKGKMNSKGNEENYTVEIEPHEYEDAHQKHLEIVNSLKNYFCINKKEMVVINHAEGLAMFSTEEVSRVNIKGLENLEYALSKNS